MEKTKSFKILRKYIWEILRYLNIAPSVLLILKSGLKEDGWFKSYITNQSIDAHGNPIPWNTYPYIKFIDSRLNKTFRVFEFGSGNSTLWYSKRVKQIISVEHDKNWYDKIKSLMPDNALLIYKNLKYNGEYSKEILKHTEKFHIIIIDGRDRVNCIKNSLFFLTSDGLIVFDNSNLDEYREAIQLLNDNKFKRLDFWGLAPITAHNCCTSIFYKENNCLNI